MSSLFKMVNVILREKLKNRKRTHETEACGANFFAEDLNHCDRLLDAFV